MDELRYHSQDTHCCDLQKFTSRDSTSRALSKKDSVSPSASTELNIKKPVEFVSKMIELPPFPCIESFAPNDITGIKRKRGRPKKHCTTSSEKPQSPAPKVEPKAKVKRGIPKENNSKSNLPWSPMIQGKLETKRTRGRPRRRYSTLSMESSCSSASFQSHDVPYLESETELETLDNESESDSDYEFVEPSELELLGEGYWVSSKRRREGRHCIISSRDSPQVVIYDGTQTKHTNPKDVTPVNANPLILGTSKELQEQTSSGAVDDANLVIEGDAIKCNICSQLEIQLKSDAELKQLCECEASVLPLLGDVAEPVLMNQEYVLINIEDKNRDGLVRWYPCHGARGGVAVVVNSGGVIDYQNQCYINDGSSN